MKLQETVTDVRFDLDAKLSAMLLDVAEKHPKLAQRSWIGITTNPGTFTYTRVTEAEYTPVGVAGDRAIVIFRTGDSVAFGVFDEDMGVCFEAPAIDILTEHLLPDEQITRQQRYLADTLVRNVEELLR